MKVEVDGETWEVRWHHEPYRAKEEYYVGKDEAGAPALCKRFLPLPRHTDCEVTRSGERVAIARTSPFFSDSAWGDRKSEQFARATGRKTSLRKALTAISADISKSGLRIECLVPREVRSAIWDEYHRQWPFDPLDVQFRNLLKVREAQRIEEQPVVVEDKQYVQVPEGTFVAAPVEDQVFETPVPPVAEA